MLYFAYGSNLDFEQMRSRCPSAITVSKAILPKYRLAFTRLSEARKGGVADIVPSERGAVEGVLYEITDEDARRLDSFEGVAAGCYRRVDVEVTLPARETIEVFTYKAFEQGRFKPSKAYMQHIITGARYHGLSLGYIAVLEATKTAD